MNEKYTNYKILLVDDDVRFHKDFRDSFGDKFEIEGAINEGAMWEQLKSNKFDLILLDLMLDGKDAKTGQRLNKPLNERYPDIPVIVVTADAKVFWVVSSMKNGAKSFFSKEDYDYNFWRKHINNVIKSSKAEEEIERLQKGDATKKNGFHRGLKGHARDTRAVGAAFAKPACNSSADRRNRCRERRGCQLYA